MAHIASIPASTASSPPSSSTAQPVSETPESLFLTLLGQATTQSDRSDTSSSAPSGGTKSVNAQTSDSLANRIQQQIKQLLDKGVSLDSITQTLASKLVSLNTSPSDGSFKNKVAAVKDYLKAGVDDTSDHATAAKAIAAKLKLLADAVGTQTASQSSGTNDFGNILDAAQAGDTPTPTDASTASNAQSTDTKIESHTDVASDMPDDQKRALAAAVAALQAAPTPVAAKPITQAPSAVTAVQDASSAASSNGKPRLSDLATNAQVPEQTASGVSHAQVAARTNPDAGTADAAAHLTLGERSQQGLQVASDLAAVAAGQGTALARALIRAANVDVNAGLTVSATKATSTLDSLTASLDALLGMVETRQAASAQGQTQNNASQNGDDLDATLAGIGGASGPATTLASGGSTFATAVARASEPLHPDDLIGQVVRGISIKNFASNPSVKITLSPEHLGEVRVDIRVTDNAVHASIVAQSDDVRNLLQAHRTELGAALAEAGLTLASLKVDVDSGGSQHDADRRQAERDQIFAARRSEPSTDVPIDDTSSGVGGPSLLAGVDMQLLNQLV